MDAPDDSVIKRIKAELPDRALHMVEMIDGEESYVFIMSGPNREEFRKYTTEMKAAGDDVDKLNAAVERAALAQIRWPDRDSVKELFNAKPLLAQNFAEELGKAAGSTIEVRSKKL